MGLFLKESPLYKRTSYSITRSDRGGALSSTRFADLVPKPWLSEELESKFFLMFVDHLDHVTPNIFSNHSLKKVYEVY